LKKLRTQGSQQHRAGNGRKRKIGAKCTRYTPMLTQKHKQHRVEWAKQHINDWNTMKRRVEKRKPTNVNELKIFLDEE
jgi:hypothetical protein